MKNIGVKKPHIMTAYALEIGFLLFVMVLLWPLGQHLIISADVTAGYIDPGIWLLVLLSLISFLLVAGLSFWLLQRLWLGLGLPVIEVMVLQFKTLDSWKQLSFYWASFVSLLFAAVGCLIAIC
ncbi:hypothetical protein SAMN05421820_101842 [Pedobacter steynii]|uniref:Uncharacterized protein n=1 Tax=Pedobacter steynii TaxID=430522 RepID=A0A1G9LC32_9SPHI|nr:hypothetical protein [Pedobacter steynii]NQX38807.1 hypothetical protein [Pedobacter steynii]SDL59521.1 hypothetical protein SAMN05421820_101842 [Pedobacter steynii]